MYKVYITQSSKLGRMCRKWADENISHLCHLVESIDDSNILISAFHNKIIAKSYFQRGNRGFNFHAGILPEYKGSCTINWAIINGESETGITLHEMTPAVDSGDIVLVEKIEIAPNDTAGTLYERLEELAYKIFKENIVNLVCENYKSTPQSEHGVRLFKRSDIESVKDLTRFIRAFDFDGKEPAYYLNRNGDKIFLRYD